MIRWHTLATNFPSNCAYCTRESWIMRWQKNRIWCWKISSWRRWWRQGGWRVAGVWHLLSKCIPGSYRHSRAFDHIMTWRVQWFLRLDRASTCSGFRLLNPSACWCMGIMYNTVTPKSYSTRPIGSGTWWAAKEPKKLGHRNIQTMCRKQKPYFVIWRGLTVAIQGAHICCNAQTE